MKLVRIAKTLKRMLPEVLYVVFLGGLLYTYATILAGCGSAIGTHASVADALRTVNDQAVEVVETECRTRAIDAAQNAPIEEAEARAAEILEVCAAIRDGQHAFAEAHGLWVAFLVKAVADESFDERASLRLATSAVRFYMALLPLAVRVGFELPELPDIVTSLVPLEDQ